MKEYDVIKTFYIYNVEDSEDAETEIRRAMQTARLSKTPLRIEIAQKMEEGQTMTFHPAEAATENPYEGHHDQ